MFLKKHKHLSVFVIIFVAWHLKQSQCFHSEISFIYLDDHGTPFVSQESHDNEVVTGTFTDKTESEGFSYLTIEANSAFPDEVQAYSAGYMEGILTSLKINQMFSNTGAGGWPISDNVKSFIAENLYFMKAKVDRNQDHSYWYHTGLLMFQIKGIEDAFLGNPCKVSRDIDPMGPMWMFQWQMGELSDIETKFGSVEKRFPSFSCSALVRNLGSDLLASHVTWGDYIMMLRIIKKVTLPFRMSNSDNQTLPAATVLESSYPAIINSVDDYYITSQKLTILETTNGIQNRTLYDYITANNSAPYFVRVMVSNRLSSSGQEWTDYFGKFNSGTYNNQWMVVDYKQFNPKDSQPIKAGTLHVLEQLPGFIMAKDMSHTLVSSDYQNAWVSYNVPYFEATQQINNYSAYINEYGLFYSHDQCPRANIFRRDLHKSQDLNSTIALMRYNDFQNDPYAKCNCTPLGYSSENGISARCELNPLNGTYNIASESARCHGATDFKITNAEMINSLQMVAISGPTHSQQPVFDWTLQENTACKGISPEGHPKRFKFGPVLVDI
ncbi:putative phospholipase B-like 2 [Symsagittifera roscoffensis]|uniref:putative phospholipase B-like 2 n=1 Tax=Symsagittifera roscoffensis TaxID=84072 RepID=UPI00307C1AB6